MSKSLFLCIGSVLSHSALQGQTLFDRAYPVVGDTIAAPFANMAIVGTVDHGFWSASGQTLENGTGTPVDFILAQRTAADGSVAWRRKYMHSNGDGFIVSGTAELSDGSLIIHGSGLYPLSWSKSMYLRTDPSGVPLVAKWYEQGTQGTQLENAHMVNDSTLLFCGRTHVGTSQYAAGWYAFADLDGNLYGAQHVGTTPATYAKFEHAASCPGGFILTGGSTRTVNPDTTLWGITIARIDSTGAVLWAGKLEEAGPSAIFYGEHAFAVPGGFRVFAESRKQGTSHTDLLMFALNEQGAIQWQKRFWFTTHSAGCPNIRVFDAGDGSYWITGGYGFMGRAAIVIDTSGTVLSAYSSGGGNANTHFAAAHTADGTIATLGSAPNPNGAGDHVPELTNDWILPTSCSPGALAYVIDTADFQFTDTWSSGPLTFTTTDFTPDLLTAVDVPDVHDLCIAMGGPEQSSMDRVRLGPNPASDAVMVTGADIRSVVVNDAAGRIVLTRSFNGGGSVTLDVRALGSGIYAVRARTTTGEHTVKLIKE